MDTNLTRFLYFAPVSGIKAELDAFGKNLSFIRKPAEFYNPYALRIKQ